MKAFFTALALGCLATAPVCAQQSSVLFDGSSLAAWDFEEGGWEIDADGAMTCNMKTVTTRNGQKRQSGMGYIWTKADYEDFSLSLSYKLSETANSGVFFRTDPGNPVQGGFEIQLADNEGFQKDKGKRSPNKLNGAFYDCQAPSSNPANPVGKWNDLKVTVKGPNLTVELNGVVINEANIDHWGTPNQNPDGSKNKFKTALKDLPRTGRIGFQNHGQVVWFRNIAIQSL